MARGVDYAAGRMLPYLLALAIGLVVLDITCLIALEIGPSRAADLDKPASPTATSSGVATAGDPVH
jgi:hypothetical protein